MDIDRRCNLLPIFLLMLLPAFAAAQEGGDRPLSQMYFDQSKKEVHKDSGDPDLLGTLDAAIEGKPVGAPAVPEPIGDSKPVDGTIQKPLAAPKVLLGTPIVGAIRGSAVAEPEKPAEKAPERIVVKPTQKEITPNEFSFIIPRLKGPSTDEKNELEITSKAGWPIGAGDNCRKTTSSEHLCKRAEAMREVLTRYSGNDDLALQCVQECGKNGESSLVNLRLADTKQLGFSVITREGQCRFQFSRKKDAKWVTTKTNRLTCVCLPKDCA